jgi:hypothetical protein
MADRKTMSRVYFSAIRVFGICLVAISASQAFAQRNAVTLDDFDGAEKLSQRWVAVGDIKLARVDVPAGVKHEGVRGMMVRAEAKAQAKFAAAPSFARPDYEKAQSIRFRAKADEVSAEKPLTLEFQVYSDQRRAWFWRKVTLDKPDWQTVELPLRYFRYSPGAALDWKETHRFAIHFRDAGTLSVDGFELVPGEGPHPAYLSAEELGRFAFGDEAVHFRGEPFVVVTDEQKLDGKAVLAALEELETLIERDFPDLPRATRPVLVLVFAEREAYQDFWPKFGERFNSVVPEVASDGYTLLGVAGSSYSDEYGPVRPSYVHEACHALLAQVLGIANQSEWLHEGLANYYQLHWTGQDVHALMRDRIEAGKHVPLEALLNGQSISARDYGQAVLFVEWLVEDPARRKAFWSAMLEMKERASTDLAPLAAKHFGKTLAEMEAAWLEWARGQHRRD